MSKEYKYLLGCLLAISEMVGKGSHAFVTKVEGKWETIEWSEICDWIDRRMDVLEEVKKMELKDTIEGMTSTDYKERFKAEYCQVKIRARKLRETIIKLKNNQLDFNPKCSGDILHDQLVHMLAYENILRERAEIEGIDLEKKGV